MSILSGFFKTKRYRKTADGYKLESNWTSGNTVELDDGNTVQNNLGAIKGITTSTSVTETGYAADATTVAALNESLSDVNNNLTQCPTKINKTYSVANQSFEYKINSLSLIFITYGSYQTADFYVCRCMNRYAYALVPIYKTGNIDDTYDINLDIESKILTITSKNAWLQVNVISL